MVHSSGAKFELVDLRKIGGYHFNGYYKIIRRRECPRLAFTWVLGFPMSTILKRSNATGNRQIYLRQ